MADEAWSTFDTETDPTGMEVVGLYPDGSSPTSKKNIRISLVNFFSSLLGRIEDNEDDISILEEGLSTIQSLLYKPLIQTINSDYTMTQNADSLLIEMSFIRVSGTPVFKVGTTEEGNEILRETTLSSGGYTESINSLLEYTSTSRTLYITLSGGTVKVVNVYRTDYFNLT